MSWARRRWFKLWTVWLLFGSACALVALFLSQIDLPGVGVTNLDDAQSRLSSKLGIFSFLMKTPFVDTITAAHPELVVAGFGFFVVGGLATAGRRVWFYDRFLDDFNDDVLERVRDADRTDRDAQAITFVQLAWLLPGKGARRLAWDQLVNWASSHKTDDARLSMAILVGRTGSGKSRMAYEFARMLARRDVLGGETPKASLLWRLAAYWRRVAPFVGSRADDPWDAGLLRAGDDFQQYCAGLAKWQPRRPTVLILDDPLSGWCDEVWRALVAANAARRFKHPVRLLIVNQTVPGDTPFAWSPLERQWQYNGVRAAVPPIRLPVEAWFSEDEALQAVFKTGLLLSFSEDRKKLIREKLFSVTQGNPLLVQLALEWILDGKSFDQLTSEALSVARANRIINALNSRSIVADAQFASLALATMVGGVEIARLEHETRRLYPSYVPLPSRAVLRACFPAEPLDVAGETRIPAVRPDIVGDAFVDVVLAHLGEHRAKELVEAAFRLNASRMLRGATRRRSAHSATTTAIRSMQLTAIPELSLLELSLAYADLAIICHPSDRPFSVPQLVAAYCEDCERILSRFAADERVAFCAELLGLCRQSLTEPLERQVRGDVLVRLVKFALASDGAVAPASLWIDYMSLLKAINPPLLASTLPVESIIASLERVQVDQLALLVEALTNPPLNPFQAFQPIWAYASTRLASHAVEASSEISRSLKAARYATLACGSDWKRANAACERAKEKAATLASTTEVARDLAECHSLVVTAVLQAADIGDGELTCVDGHLMALRRIVDKFDKDVELLATYAHALAYSARIGARLSMGWIERTQPALSEIEHMCVKYEHESELRSTLSYAYRLPVWIWASVGNESLDAEEEIVRGLRGCLALADRWRADARIAATAVEACLEAMAFKRPGLAEATGKYADEIVPQALRIAERFPERADIQAKAASVIAMCIYRWNQINAGQYVERCRELVKSARNLGMRFPDNYDIQLQVVTAIRYEAFAWSCVPAGAGSAQIQSALDEIKKIASRFPGQEGMAYEIVQNLSDFCRALASGGSLGGGRRAGSLATYASELAAAFPAQMDIQKQAASCRLHEASAWLAHPEGASSTEIALCIEQLNQIVLRYPDSREVVASLCGCYDKLAKSLAELPNGVGMASALEASELAITFARKFGSDQEIGTYAARAVNSVVIACKAQPQTNLAGISVALEKYEEFIGRFLSDEIVIGVVLLGLNEAANLPATEEDVTKIVTPAAKLARQAADGVRDSQSCQHLALLATVHEYLAWNSLESSLGAEAAKARAFSEAASIAERWPGKPEFMFEMNRLSRLERGSQG